MFKSKSLNAALALALGLSFGVATAQTDQPAQQGNALDKPSNKADQQAVGIPAKPGTQSGPAAQLNTGHSEQSAQDSGRPFEFTDEFAYLDSAPRAGEAVYGWQPSERVSAPQSSPPLAFGDQLAQLGAGEDVYGWRPSEAVGAQQSDQPFKIEQRLAQRNQDKTTGQGQGVRESGGQADVKTPAQSGGSPVEHFAHSGSAPGAGTEGRTGGA